MAETSKLSKSKCLNKRAEIDFDFRQALYYAYNTRRGYGSNILELYIADDDNSMFSDIREVDTDQAIEPSSSNLSGQIRPNRRNHGRILKKIKKFPHNGITLKLVP